MTAEEVTERIAVLRDRYRREKDLLQQIGCAAGVSLEERRYYQAALRLKLAAIRRDIDLLRAGPTDEIYEQLRYDPRDFQKLDLQLYRRLGERL